jgi:hypothetical protein
MSETRPDLEIPEPGGAEPEAKSVNIPELRERARKWIAIGLVIIFGLEVLGSMAAAWFCSIDTHNIKDIMELVLGPTVALVGSVVGFYFGTYEGAQTPQ